ncbi:MAG: hypothetical protein DI535_29885 [Citrobacter freundii]|nr:MAG: hypothetical protein DI535_29885 [Citrobacter freundii]
MKKLKNFLEYLYYNYYYFQVRVGNALIAEYMAIIIITFILNIYFVLLTIILQYVFNIDLPTISKPVYIFIIILILLFLYFILVHNDKYKKIIKNTEISKKSKISAFIFPLFGILAVFIGMYIKMLQNQGKL